MLPAGEPGIGESRLASEFARRVAARSGLVLYGRWDPESLIPYQPSITAVEHYIAPRPTPALPEALQPELRELAASFRPCGAT